MKKNEYAATLAGQMSDATLLYVYSDSKDETFSAAIVAEIKKRLDGRHEIGALDGELHFNIGEIHQWVGVTIEGKMHIENRSIATVFEPEP